jgi:ubiquinol oxidase
VLGSRNFAVELAELGRSLRRAVGMEMPAKYAPPDCLGLTLSDDAVAEREQQREAARGDSWPVSPPVTLLYKVLCRLIDALFVGRPIPRMWFLEVVARIPYFSYTSCLHLLSTLGWWRSPELSNIHHAEELNEAFHLAVMESLGGDRKWGDRFMAFHAAIMYYWFLVVLFFLSPGSSYGFSELLEGHAVDTYAQLLEENADTLRALPAPEVAHVYFNDFIYYFEAFQMDSEAVRRPTINNLYDVFDNIYRDEVEHVKTMTACREYTSDGKPLQYKGRDLRTKSRGSRKPMSAEERRSFWRKWTTSKVPGSVSKTSKDAATKV